MCVGELKGDRQEKGYVTGRRIDVDAYWHSTAHVCMYAWNRLDWFDWNCYDKTGLVLLYGPRCARIFRCKKKHACRLGRVVRNSAQVFVSICLSNALNIPSHQWGSGHARKTVLINEALTQRVLELNHCHLMNSLPLSLSYARISPSKRITRRTRLLNWMDVRTAHRIGLYRVDLRLV